MKRIEFIAPVEAMRGNLSGAQNLKYPTQNNKAYESPLGSVNYARNYSTRFVGAKRASDGLKYFAVKTKTATHITARSLQAMALLGGAGAMYAALVRNKASVSYTGIYAQWIELQNLGNTKSFRSYVMDNLRQMLASKSQTAVFAGPRPAVTINNPWVAETQTEGVQVTDAILVKFWPQLAINGITFEVNGMKGIAYQGGIFTNLYDNEPKNVLNINQEAIGPNPYVTIGGQFIKYDSDYVLITDTIVANGKYTLSDIRPTNE